MSASEEGGASTGAPDATKAWVSVARRANQGEVQGAFRDGAGKWYAPDSAARTIAWSAWKAAWEASETRLLRLMGLEKKVKAAGSARADTRRETLPP